MQQTQGVWWLLTVVVACAGACASEPGSFSVPTVGEDGGIAFGAAGADSAELGPAAQDALHGGAAGVLASAEVVNGEPLADASVDAAGAVLDAADGGKASSEREPCMPSDTNGSQVVFIGDSFLAAPTSEIAPNLEQLWQQAGSPGYSVTPRYHQLVGTTMQQIAEQYDAAHRMNPDIHVVIADGGGNDVLVTDRSCLTQPPPANASCKATVEHAVHVADTLLAKMEADGVSHVVFFFYPHERTEGLFQGTAPAINASLDYAEPLARAACEDHAICTFVSLREAAGDALGSGFTDRGYINANDVHPSTAGSKFFAQAIWDQMQRHCILSP